MNTLSGWQSSGSTCLIMVGVETGYMRVVERRKVKQASGCYQLRGLVLVQTRVFKAEFDKALRTTTGLIQQGNAHNLSTKMAPAFVCWFKSFSFKSLFYLKIGHYGQIKNADGLLPEDKRKKCTHAGCRYYQDCQRRYMAQGHDGKGNKMTALLNEAKALQAIKDGVATKGF